MKSIDHDKYFTKNPIKKALIRNFQNYLIEVISRHKLDSILDVGCGAGHVIKLIKGNDRNVKVVGMDIDINALNEAKANNVGVEFIIGDIHNLPFDDSSFDLVICSEVLEHLNDPTSAMNELTRVSSKFLLLSVPHEPLFWACNLLTFNHISNFGNAPGHLNHWGLKRFNNFVNEHYEKYEVKSVFPWIVAHGTVCQ